MSDPKTAVELWNSQREGLPEITLNNVALGDIEAMLGALWHDSETAMGAATTDEQKELLANRQNQLVAVWEKAKGIQANAVQYFATLGSGAAAIQAVQGQLEAVSSELDDLLQAIEDQDSNHPQLETLIQGVSDEAYSDGFVMGQEAMDVSAAETLADYIVEVTAYLVGLGRRHDARWTDSDVCRLLKVVLGKEAVTDHLLTALFTLMNVIADERQSLYESGAA